MAGIRLTSRRHEWMVMVTIMNDGGANERETEFLMNIQESS